MDKGPKSRWLNTQSIILNSKIHTKGERVEEGVHTPSQGYLHNLELLCIDILFYQSTKRFGWRYDVSMRLNKNQQPPSKEWNI